MVIFIEWYLDSTQLTQSLFTRPSFKGLPGDEIQSLMKHLRKGPFMVSALDIKPHQDQRPIDPSHVELLAGNLVGIDLRLENPVYIMVPDQLWAKAETPKLGVNAGIVGG